MKYQNVKFKLKAKSCFLDGREVTGTAGNSDNESLVKMVDIIDDLTSVEDHPMKPGDMFVDEDRFKLFVIAGKGDRCTGLINVYNQIPKAIRVPSVDLFGNVTMEIKPHEGDMVELNTKIKKFEVYSYEDVRLQTDGHSTDKTVTVWK